MTYQDVLAHVRAQGASLQVTADSRTVRPGDVFVAISGTESDGARYIADALQAGATYVVCSGVAKLNLNHSLEGQMTRRCVMHESPRTALWQLASACHGTEDIWQKMHVIGITGTNGKTTSSYLLEHLFSHAGHKVGVMGTVSYRWPGYEEEAALTTPDSVTVHRILKAMYDAHVTVVIMEVSSHALEQERVGGVHFSGGIFCNLTQDHLDYHKNMDTYFAAKATLFTQYPLAEKAMAINVDDTWGVKLVEGLQQKTLLHEKSYSFALKNEAYAAQIANASAETKPATQHVQGEICAMSTKGLHLKMTLHTPNTARAHTEKKHPLTTTWELHSPLVGAFNASNLLAVQSLALGMGLSVEDLQYLSSFGGVCGRLERVENAQDVAVFVDYAHTPDALTNVLQALKGAGFTKIITVFGCGGNRDRTKRPLMGAAVAELSQVAMLTSDNPRFEEPEAILQDVLPGLQGKDDLEIVVEVDRRKATEKALEILLASDTKAAVLIAGKGHEDYQIIQGVKHPYSDQATVREFLSCKQV